MNSHYSILLAHCSPARFFIIDNTSNVIALMSPKESQGFEGAYLQLKKLQCEGFDDFFDERLEMICDHFMGVAA